VARAEPLEAASGLITVLPGEAAAMVMTAEADTASSGEPLTYDIALQINDRFGTARPTMSRLCGSRLMIPWRRLCTMKRILIAYKSRCGRKVFGGGSLFQHSGKPNADGIRRRARRALVHPGVVAGGIGI